MRYGHNIGGRLGKASRLGGHMDNWIVRNRQLVIDRLRSRLKGSPEKWSPFARSILEADEAETEG